MRDIDELRTELVELDEESIGIGEHAIKRDEIGDEVNDERNTKHVPCGLSLYSCIDSLDQGGATGSQRRRDQVDFRDILCAV